MNLYFAFPAVYCITIRITMYVNIACHLEWRVKKLGLALHTQNHENIREDTELFL